MRVALIMCCVLLVLMVYRRLMQVPCIQHFLHHDIPISAFFFQYYTLLLACIAVLILDSLAYLVLLLTPLLFGPHAVADSLSSTLSSIEGLDTKQVEEWRKKLYIDQQLQQTSAHAPIAVVLTLAVVCLHVFHLVKDHNVNGLAWFPSQRQDWVLQVILLPAMYAVMALRCVIRCWEVMLGSAWEGFASDHGSHSESTWLAYVHHSMELYDANFAVANFAEMYTLMCFSRLCLDLLKRTFTSIEGFRIFSCVTMQGVDSFVLCGFMKVLCQILISFQDLKTPRDNIPQVLDPGSAASSLDDSKGITSSPLAAVGLRLDLTYADGFLRMLLVMCSIQCLYNVMMICWMSELRDINPSLKFTGTRALIMFAQWQSAGLDFAGAHLDQFPYGEQQVRLWHASLMCYECLLVSLLHVVSWPAEDFENGYLPLEDDDGSWKEPSRWKAITSRRLWGNRSPASLESEQQSAGMRANRRRTIQ